MSNTSFKSMKGSSDGEIWNPTSKQIQGKDGKMYSARNANPSPGFEPEMVGYYTGKEYVESKVPDRKGNNLHKFQTPEGVIIKVWGSHDLDKQLAAAEVQYGLGRLTMVKWNGYLAKSASKDKPAEILAQGLPADHYHDWEVLVDDVTPGIKVAGTETYKPVATNTVATPVETMPDTLDAVLESEEEDLPY